MGGNKRGLEDYIIIDEDNDLGTASHVPYIACESETWNGKMQDRHRNSKPVWLRMRFQVMYRSPLGDDNYIERRMWVPEQGAKRVSELLWAFVRRNNDGD